MVNTRSGPVRSNCGRYNTIPRLKPSFSAHHLNLRPNHTSLTANTGDASYIYNTINNNHTVNNTNNEMDSEEGGQREEDEDRYQHK